MQAAGGFSGSLPFNPGETNERITVKINSNTTVEPDETIFVNLTVPLNATLVVGQASVQSSTTMD